MSYPWVRITRDQWKELVRILDCEARHPITAFPSWCCAGRWEGSSMLHDEDCEIRQALGILQEAGRELADLSTVTDPEMMIRPELVSTQRALRIAAAAIEADRKQRASPDWLRAVADALPARSYEVWSAGYAAGLGLALLQDAKGGESDV